MYLLLKILSDQNYLCLDTTTIEPNQNYPEANTKFKILFDFILFKDVIEFKTPERVFAQFKSFFIVGTNLNAACALL